MKISMNYEMEILRQKKLEKQNEELQKRLVGMTAEIVYRTLRSRKGLLSHEESEKVLTLA